MRDGGAVFTSVKKQRMRKLEKNGMKPLISETPRCPSAVKVILSRSADLKICDAVSCDEQSGGTVLIDERG